MGDQRHPKPYIKGIRKQMTPAWKQRVLAVLADNDTNKRSPANLAELAKLIGADKAGIYETFRLESTEPNWKPQSSSAYVDAICEALEIDPPLEEIPPANDELEKLLNRIRSLPEEEQQRWVGIIQSILKTSE